MAKIQTLAIGSYIRNPSGRRAAGMQNIEVLQIAANDGNSFLCYPVTSVASSNVTVDTTRYVYIPVDSDVQQVTVGNSDWQLAIPCPSLGSASSDNEVWAMVQFNGFLYIGYYTALGTQEAKLFKWDGQTLTLEYTFGTGSHFQGVYSLAVLGANLYAGIEGGTNGDADVYVSNGSDTKTWTKSFDDTTHKGVFCMTTFQGKIYAGFAFSSGQGDIYSFDGATWSLAYDGTSPNDLVEWFETMNGNLYVAVGGNSDGNAQILKFDGNSWSVVYDGTGTNYQQIVSLAYYKGKYYAGALRSGTNAGADIFVSGDGLSWSLAYSYPTGNRVHCLHVYNNRLYAGIGNGAGQNAILVFDGTTWAVSFAAKTEREAFRLQDYNGVLYAGMGYKKGDANIYRYKEPT